LIDLLAFAELHIGNSC